MMTRKYFPMETSAHLLACVHLVCVVHRVILHERGRVATAHNLQLAEALQQGDKCSTI